MAIEVTSLSGRKSSNKRLTRPFSIIIAALTHGKHRLLLNTVIVLLTVTLSGAVFSLYKSYSYYAQVVDMRLANGYLTSQPGIYAAPRVLSPGKHMSLSEVLANLRRAGYVEDSSSAAWSGSFRVVGETLEIRPSTIHKLGPEVVRVTFDARDRISQLTGDQVTLESFALEPEVLTNDNSSKTTQRTRLTYNDLPPVLTHAILSIEDRRFFDHSGVDLVGILRAALHDAGDDQQGQGGSTITQQLVKNTYLTPERSLRRKYAEAMLALALERRLSKQDILGLYCNEVYLGQRGAATVRGVDQAARLYFGKNVKDLTLAEAATIAGMIQSPAHFSPTRHQEAAVARRNIVLGTMVRDGWITLQEASRASQEPVTIAAGPGVTESQAPYFVDFVNRLLDSSLEGTQGVASLAGRAQGRLVFSTIDLELQQVAEQAIQTQLVKLDQLYKNSEKKPQAALVALDPQTGDVLAMVGGRNYADSQLNRAVDARRQPGSTFKPFVYAAALESSMSPTQLFTDAPRKFTYDRNRVYRPANYGGTYSMRDVTMRTGLVKSLNVVTVDIALKTGLARIANLAEQFGLPKPERYPALALGTTEVTPLQLAAAYSSFVNGGIRVEPRAVVSVDEPRSAHPLREPVEAKQIIKPTTAYMITNTLAAVIDHGTARAARGTVKGTAIAGKTGTSRDGWFVGFTPNLVCAVWIGFDDNEQLGVTGATAALPAWTDFMKSAVVLRPELGGRNFPCPEGIEFVEIDPDNGLLATLSCPSRELIAITAGLAPKLECSQHFKPMYESSSMSSVASNEAPPPPKPTIRVSPPPSSSRFRGTQVEVDANGRRKLVSDFR